LNDYTAFMAGSEMAGDYFGYDGPCPPWNDKRLHHYVFTVYALDVESLDLPERFDGREALAAMRGHVLAEAGITGTYSLHPDL
jgi:Raf kinase inhibitor-like YbhB/YbcL family protein